METKKPTDTEKSLQSSILQLCDLQKDLDNFITSKFFNSQPVISMQVIKPLTSLKFTLTDILLIGAITQSSVLISGSSGSGKTFLAELILNFLFTKEGYARKNITPDMNEQDFMDIDFGAIKEGKKLKEAMLADQLFTRPSLIIDEANRAPPIIQNRLMQILENNIDLKSKTIKAGKVLPSGEIYHWVILTLNIGAEYAGTSAVDRALKDRITLDIPIDNFPPILEDQIQMIRMPTGGSESQNPIAGIEGEIFDLYSNRNQLGISLEAEALLLYLSFMSNCVKSPTESKYGVRFSPQYCKDNNCPYARNPPLNRICPYTFAPSNRVLRRVVQVAKGFVLLKHAKIIQALQKTANKEKVNQYLKSNADWEVKIEDILAIAPLVLHSKVSMNPEWVLNEFNGNTFLAVKEYLKTINTQLTNFMENILPGLIAEKKGESLSEKDKGYQSRALKDDFHFEGLIKYVKEYLG